MRIEVVLQRHGKAELQSSVFFQDSRSSDVASGDPGRRSRWVGRASSNRENPRFRNEYVVSPGKRREVVDTLRNQSRFEKAFHMRSLYSLQCVWRGLALRYRSQPGRLAA